MHKYVSMILAIVMVIALAVPAAAAPANKVQQVYIEEIDASVVVPDQYDVMLRSTPKNDPVFTSRGMDVDEFHAWVEEQDIYMNAQSKQDVGNFTVKMSEAEDFESFLECDYEYMEEEVEKSVEYYEKWDCEVLEAEIYEQSDVPFVRIDYYNPEYKEYCMNFYTILDVLDEDEEVVHMSYALNYATGKKLNAETEKMVLAFVDSFNPGVYYDSNTGVFFQPSAQWFHNTENEKDGTNAWFEVSNKKDEFIGFSYTNSDLLAGLTEEDLDGADREDVDMEQWTKEEAAEMAGVKASALKEVEYNDVSFYTFENKQTANNVDVYVTVVFRIEDGYMHMFMNSTNKKGAGAEEFEDWMSTVYFPE